MDLDRMPIEDLVWCPVGIVAMALMQFQNPDLKVGNLGSETIEMGISMLIRSSSIRSLLLFDS